MDQESPNIPCPIHSNEEKCSWIFKYHSSFQNYNLPIYECRTCLLQKIHPTPTNWESFYTEDYYRGNSEYSYTDERESFRFHSYTWDSRIQLIEKFHPKKRPLRFLELGSSFGGFLQRAKSRNHIVQGIEISEYSAGYANDSGIPTWVGTPESFETEAFESFDVAVLSEVIEHLPNPGEVLDRISRLLSDHSLLVIQTANFEGWQARKEGKNYHYYLPGHLFYYGESNLKRILEKRGFREFKVFYGSDVSLFSKLRKMRGSFKKWTDCFKWFKTSFYHWKSKWKKRGYPLTSGFVIYAFKGGSAEDR